MAVSYRLMMFLIALVVFGFAYALGAEIVSVLELLIVNDLSTDSGHNLYSWVDQIWFLAPVFVMIATGAWLLKQSLVAQRQ